MKGNQHALAQEHYEAALRANPYVWEAMEGLCAIGACFCRCVRFD